MKNIAWSLLLLALSVAGCSEDTPGTPGTDAGSDASLDSGASDAGVVDSGADASSMDATVVDAGESDASNVDAVVADSAEPDAFVPSDAATDGSPPIDGGGLSCDEARTNLGSLIEIGGRACSVTVRFDYESWAPLGYQVFCDSYGLVSEEDARTQGESDTDYGDGSTLLSNPGTDYAYVFYESPGDFGGASVVRRDSPMTLFGGSVVWDGMGNITYPDMWRSASELASDCSVPEDSHTRVGWDLQDGTPLGAEELTAGFSAIARTGVYDAIGFGGYIFSTVVLLYPRTVGAFDPERAEWVVILNGGWLE